MKKLFLILVATALVAACTPKMSSQYESMCKNIREAHVILADVEVDWKVDTAFHSADILCSNPPKDIPSATLTLAAIYLTISQAIKEHKK